MTTSFTIGQMGPAGTGKSTISGMPQDLLSLPTKYIFLFLELIGIRYRR